MKRYLLLRPLLHPLLTVAFAISSGVRHYPHIDCGGAGGRISDHVRHGCAGKGLGARG